MYCRNCGSEISDQAVICPNCGHEPKFGKKFCHNCKAETAYDAVICMNCGVKLESKIQNPEGKDWLTTLLLCIFLGTLGIHRFYTKHTSIGVIQLLTFGGCGIWTLVDFIRILTESYTDADGKKLLKN